MLHTEPYFPNQLPVSAHLGSVPYSLLQSVSQPKHHFILKHLSAVWGLFLYEEFPEGELLLGQEFEHFIVIPVVRLPSQATL